MKKAQGFTLIELIIVIIILGILAVTAAPKFIDIQGDARGAQLKGLKGAIAGAMNITYGKSALEGEEKVNKTDSSAPAVGTVLTSFGYPSSASAELSDAAGFDTSDFTVAASGTDGTVYIHSASTTYADAAAIVAGNCYATYVEAADKDTKATVAVEDSGC